MKLSKLFIACLVVIAAVVGAIYLYNNGRSGNASQGETQFKEFTVTRGDFQTTVSASGVVQPVDRVQIKSKASGRVEELPVEEGDVVKKGDLICRLDQTDILADVEQAKANLDIAEAELKQAQNTSDRKEQLFGKALISEDERDQAALALAQAKAQIIRATTALDQANVRLDETIVTAPINGIVLQKYVEIGQIIASGVSNVGGGTAIADIADMRLVHIEAGIDEIDVGKIQIGQPARVVADAYPQMKFSGKIIRISPEARVEQNVTLFDVVIEVENPEGRLKSGMNASVEITIAREENVLLVPTMALSMPMPGEAPRNVRNAMVKEGNAFAPRDVEIGMGDFKQTIVISGLSEGDIVGMPMVSRLKAENDEMEQRIKDSRSFGTTGASGSGGQGGSARPAGGSGSPGGSTRPSGGSGGQGSRPGGSRPPGN